MARLTLITIAGIVIIAGALGLLYAISRQDLDESTPVIAAPSSGPSEAEQIAAVKQNEALPIAPTFDVVRVNPNGDTVVAGRAMPGAIVTLLDSGQAIGQMKADDRGQWVLLPNAALAPGEHRLSLKAEMEKGGYSESERVVIVVVPQAALDISGRPSEEEDGVLTLEVPKSGDGASRLLNMPENIGAKEGLALDIIDYTSDGKAIFSGRAASGARIFLYLDDKFAASALAEEKGVWRAEITEKISPGKYKLRIDQVGQDGKVEARIETRFEQADFAKNMQAGGQIIVQPGNSLWRLARRFYGEGVRYTIIYEVNKDQIGDPNLIYPGQIFEIPPTQ